MPPTPRFMPQDGMVGVLCSVIKPPLDITQKGQTGGEHVNVTMKMKTGLLQNFNCPQKNRSTCLQGDI
ncbi:hypothetical protein ATANTOWER_016414 [Ataeniobius toweri]|uniref:Uncharacterized protein n=1 Tax=Ataeniobius toweri TaxID=208326 RepID=A0ABU7AGE5_9TELE|nr:hypothetical protein [Ataeniobius toweri]